VQATAVTASQSMLAAAGQLEFTHFTCKRRYREVREQDSLIEKNIIGLASGEGIVPRRPSVTLSGCVCVAAALVLVANLPIFHLFSN